MFMKIKIHSVDQESQRFLWRGKDRDKGPDECVLTSMLFSAKSSPCSALLVKNRNAQDFAHIKPAAAKSIEHDSYMDDYLVSFETQSESVSLVRK